MDNQHEDDDEIDLTTVEDVSQSESDLPNKIERLPIVCGFRKWINKNDDIHVEKCNIYHDNHEIINETVLNKLEDATNSPQIDLSLNHFDVQLQVTDGKLQPINRYGVFSALLSNNNNQFKANQYSQTIEPIMDTSESGERQNDNQRSYSYKYYETSGNNNGSYRSIRQSGGSSGNGGNGNGSNPNRNNDNSRRPNDNDGDGDNDDDDDDDNDDETDENLAHKLGFRPVDNATIRTIGRIRSLANKRSFGERDVENVGYLIDELIHLQHLENSSYQQLEKLVRLLKLHRLLRTRSNAVAFIEQRLPQRINRTSSNHNSNVFDIWRERERRSRADSKDSLEDDTQNVNGHQIRDSHERKRSVSPVIHSNNTSRVRQMARNIDTKTIPSSPRGEYVRNISPPSPNRLPNQTYFEEHIHLQRHSPTRLSPEQRRVRQMIDRLESTAAPSSSQNLTKKTFTKQTYNNDQPIDTIPFSTVTHVTRRDNNNSNDSFIFRHQSPIKDAGLSRFELDRNEILNHERRTTSGPNIDAYLTSLQPNTETAITMVREVRARLYEDESAVIRTNADTIPVKVDLETLYILEEKTDKRTMPSKQDNSTTDYENNHLVNKERHDYQTHTVSPSSTLKPSNRPIGIQVNSTNEQNSAVTQTTDTLHRSLKERQTILSPPIVDEDDSNNIIRKITTTTRYEVKRRHSSHTSEGDDNAPDNNAVIYIETKEDIDEPERPLDNHVEQTTEQHSSFEQHVSSQTNTNQTPIHDRRYIRQHIERKEYIEDEYRSNEVYEVHTRGACKCLVVSSEEKCQYGNETRFENQLRGIEQTYTNEELKSTVLHVISTSSDENYQLVQRDYGFKTYDDRQPTIAIHYYNKDGQRIKIEHHRRLENLPLFVRCEIEYELNHYGSAQIIILSVSNAERRQMNVSVKNEIADETMRCPNGRANVNGPELKNYIHQRLNDQIALQHLVDYSSRDDYNQINPTDLRRVLRTDVSTSLRIVQRYRNVIHRLCQLHRSHLRLTTQAEQQRHLILAARDEYYLLNLTCQTTIISNHRQQQQRQHHHVSNQPFDYAKYRRDVAQQQKVLEQHYRKTQQTAPKTGPQSEAEFYLGSGRRALIEREIHSMRESIRPHDHAPPRYKHEPRRRSLSISYSGGPRYVRARIIHVRDYFDETQQQHHHQQQQRNAKEQELFVRVDDYINERAANTLRRSYSRDYLNEDGPRSRISYIRIPGETIRIEEKTTYEYQGVMYANLPYSLRYWNILHILDQEARQGRPLGSSLPHIIVNDPYQTVIPPLTQQEIRQTAQQVLSPNYQTRSYTDQTLRWFLSRDNCTEIESAKYLQTLNQYRQQQQRQQRQQQQHTNVTVQGGGQTGVRNKYYVTEKLVRYEKMPDRFVPVVVPINDRAQSTDNIHKQSSSTSGILKRSYHSQYNLDRAKSQSRQQLHSSTSSFTPNFNSQLSSMRSPLSRHQSVNNLHAPATLSHPPSPSPSLHSLHNNQQYRHQTHQNRRPVSFHNRYQTRSGSQQLQNPSFTEIFDSQTGQRILTTSQEQLPTEVLGLLNKYNLQQF